MRPDVANFIASLEAEPTRAVEITQAEIDRLSANLSLGSLKTYLSQRRTAVGERLGANHPAYDMLRLSDAQYETMRTSYQASVSKRQATPIRISNATGMIAAGAASLASQNPYDLVLGLCLVTGRRPFEIASNAETRIEAITKAHPWGTSLESYALRFRGQAKARGAEGSMANKAYTIPCLERATIVIAAFDRLHRLRPDWIDMTEESYKSFLVSLNRRCKAIFQPFWPIPPDGVWTETGRRSSAAELAQPERSHTGRGKIKTDTHTISVRDLRAIYAEACSRLFNRTGTPGELQKPGEYMARILGHKEDDLTTAQSYAAFVLDLVADPAQAARQLHAAIADARAKIASSIAPPAEPDEPLAVPQPSPKPVEEAAEAAAAPGSAPPPRTTKSRRRQVAPVTPDAGTAAGDATSTRAIIANLAGNDLDAEIAASSGRTARPYQPGACDPVDRALEQHTITLPPGASWWDASSALFDAGDVQAAKEAQHHAAPPEHTEPPAVPPTAPTPATAAPAPDKAPAKPGRRTLPNSAQTGGKAQVAAFIASIGRWQQAHPSAAPATPATPAPRRATAAPASPRTTAPKPGKPHPRGRLARGDEE